MMRETLVWSVVFSKPEILPVRSLGLFYANGCFFIGLFLGLIEIVPFSRLFTLLTLETVRVKYIPEIYFFSSEIYSIGLILSIW